LNNDWTFWLALMGAALLRVVTSPFHSIAWAILQIAVSLVFAWLFTDAVGLPAPQPGDLPRAQGALLALTVDGIMRAILSTAGNPKTLLSMIFPSSAGRWRGMRTHNRLWLLLILLGWALLFLSVPMIHGYAPDWPDLWQVAR